MIDGERYSEDDLMGAIDAGASDVVEEDGKLRVLAEPTDLTAVREAIVADGVEIESYDSTLRVIVRYAIRRTGVGQVAEFAREGALP